MKKFKTLKKKLKRLPAKKYLSFPTLALVVTFAVACGKQDSSSLSGQVESASASMSAAAAAQVVKKSEPSEPVPTLAEWCDQSGGFMHSEHLCEVQIKKMYGRNMMVMMNDWWSAGFDLLPNDTVQIVVSGSPKMRLGGDEISAAASRAYVVKSSGTLAFQSRSIRSRFEVREVTAKRCYDDKWKNQVCPKS